MFIMQSKPKNTKKTDFYSVPFCESKGNGDVHCHRPPMDARMRKKWLIALKMQKFTSTMRICHKHFVTADYFPTGTSSMIKRLKRTAIPSQNIPVTLLIERKKSAKLVAERKFRAEMRIEKKAAALAEEKAKMQAIDMFSLNQVQNNSMQVHNETHDDIKKMSIDEQIENDSVVVGSGLMEEQSIVDNNIDADKLINHQNNANESDQCNLLTESNKDNAVKEPENKDVKKHIIWNFLDSDKKLFSFTGIQSYIQLDTMEKCIETLRSIIKKRQIAMLIKLNLILTFTKLKQNLTYTVLSILFKISEQLAKKYFIHTIHELYAILTPQIRWPAKDEILDNMPQCFEKYRNTRIVLDCLEISMRRSKCLKCRIPTFSLYKSNHTVKFMLGVTPSGLISYVSKAYGGRTSDKFIFCKSKLLERMKRSVDAIMVDKGFLIDRECAAYDIKLIRPPFKRKNMQFSTKKAVETRDIAAARVHVERKIQRVQQYEILKGPLQNEIVPYINMIMKIICAMTNLQTPILSADKLKKKQHEVLLIFPYIYFL